MTTTAVTVAACRPQSSPQPSAVRARAAAARLHALAGRPWHAQWMQRGRLLPAAAQRGAVSWVLHPCALFGSHCLSACLARMAVLQMRKRSRRPRQQRHVHSRLAPLPPAAQQQQQQELELWGEKSPILMMNRRGLWTVSVPPLLLPVLLLLGVVLNCMAACCACCGSSSTGGELQTKPPGIGCPGVFCPLLLWVLWLLCRAAFVCAFPWPRPLTAHCRLPAARCLASVPAHADKDEKEAPDMPMLAQQGGSGSGAGGSDDDAEPPPLDSEDDADEASAAAAAGAAAKKKGGAAKKQGKAGAAAAAAAGAGEGRRRAGCPGCLLLAPAGAAACGGRLLWRVG